MTAAAADLLLSCARARPDAGDAAYRAGALDWAALTDAADFHGLMPLLHWTVGRDQAQVIPAEVAHQLKQSYIDSARRSLYLSATLTHVLSQFDAMAIPVIALKGPPLAESLYPDPALRQSFDLDLLIRPSDIGPARSLLSRQGYRIAPHLARLPEQVLLQRDCEVVLSAPDRPTIDLHWSIATDDFPFRFDAGVLWRSRQVTRFGGREIAGLNPECLLLYVCVHGAKHAWSRLHWLGDAGRLVANGVNWKRALDLAIETRCERPVLLGLLLTHELLHSAVPEAILEQARADRVILSTARETAIRLQRIPPAEPSSTARTAFNARLARTTRDRMRHWAAMFKAPKDEDLERWNLPTWLFLLYYPLRLVRLTA